MKPLYLEFGNFQSHKHSILDFTKLDKITLIIGEYEGEEGRSNGAGKTSVFDVIEWLLFDQTRASSSKTSSIEDLIRDNEKEMWGFFTFQAFDQNIYKISKTHKRRKTNPTEIKFEIKSGEEWKSIACDTLAETRKKIIQILGFEKDVFESTSLCKQHEVAGIASEDSDTRLSCVKKILKLGKWAEYSKTAKIRIDSLKKELEVHTDLLNAAQSAQENLEIQQENIKIATEKQSVFTIKVDVQKKKIEKIRKEIDEINKVLGALDQLKESLKKSENRKKVLIDELKELEKQGTEVAEKISKLKVEFQQKNERQREIENSKPDKIKLVNEYRIANEEKDKIQTQNGSLQGLLEATTEQGKNLRAELEEFKKLGIGICSKCLNQVTEDHKEEVLNTFESKLKDLRAKAIDYKNKIKEGEISLEEKKKKVDELIKQQEFYNRLIEEKNSIIERLKGINELVAAHQISSDNNKAQLATYKEEQRKLLIESEDLRQKIGAFGGSDLSIKHSNLVSQLQSENNILEDQQRQVASLQIQINNARALIEELKGKIEKAKKATEETENLRKQIGWLEILQQDFQKTIPTMILENSSTMIETEINKCLATLSDGFSVTINTQHKNKTNDNIKEVFDIQVQVGDRTRAFELLSGGERFRVAFALRVALSVIQAQETGVQIGAIFYDEPFNDLDEDGLDKIQEVFVYLSSMFDHQLAITHQNRLKESFNDIICVRKTKDGAFIV